MWRTKELSSNENDKIQSVWVGPVLSLSVIKQHSGNTSKPLTWVWWVCILQFYTLVHCIIVQLITFESTHMSNLIYMLPNKNPQSCSILNRELAWLNTNDPFQNIGNLFPTFDCVEFNRIYTHVGKCIDNNQFESYMSNIANFIRIICIRHGW